MRLSTAVGWREVIADITHGDGTKQRIDQRVDRNVGVGMARQTLAVRDLHAAQPEFLALDKAVHVKAHAGAGQSGHVLFLEVGGKSDLAQHFIAIGKKHINAR